MRVSSSQDRNDTVHTSTLPDANSHPTEFAPVHEWPREKKRGLSHDRIASVAGDDAWKVESVSAQMVKDDGSISQPFHGTFNRWLSGDHGEGRRYLDLTFRRVQFVDGATQLESP
jgi:hypothetical protein